MKSNSPLRIVGDFIPPFHLEIDDPESKKEIETFAALRDGSPKSESTVDVTIPLKKEGFAVAVRARLKEGVFEVFDFPSGQQSPFEKRHEVAGQYLKTIPQTDRPKTEAPKQTPKSSSAQDEQFHIPHRSSHPKGSARTISEGTKTKDGSLTGAAGFWIMSLGVLAFVLVAATLVVASWKMFSTSTTKPAATQKGSGNGTLTTSTAASQKPESGQPETQAQGKDVPSNIPTPLASPRPKAEQQDVALLFKDISEKSKSNFQYTGRQDGDLAIVVKCIGSVGTIRCPGYFMSTADKPENLCIEAGSSSLDNKGNEAKGPDVEFGTNWQTTAIPNNPVSFVLSFVDKSLGTATQTRLNIRVRWKYQTGDFPIENVPIHR